MIRSDALNLPSVYFHHVREVNEAVAVAFPANEIYVYLHHQTTNQVQPNHAHNPAK